MVRLLFFSLVLALMAPPASADWVLLAPCKHATGEEKREGHLTSEGVTVDPGVWVPRHALGNAVLHRVEGRNCTLVKLSNGQSVVVVGTPSEVTRRISSGPPCE